MSHPAARLLAVLRTLLTTAQTLLRCAELGPGRQLSARPFAVQLRAQSEFPRACEERRARISGVAGKGSVHTENSRPDVTWLLSGLRFVSQPQFHLNVAGFKEVQGG